MTLWGPFKDVPTPLALPERCAENVRSSSEILRYRCCDGSTLTTVEGK